MVYAGRTNRGGNLPEPEQEGFLKNANVVTGAAGLVALGRAGMMLARRRPSLKAVKQIDLARYLGAWRVIACTDNMVERNFTDAVESYAQDSAGHIHVHFRWHDKALNGPVKTFDFEGEVADESQARWRMKLLPPFRADYVILAVDRDYQWAVVGHPSRKFGWLLARQKRVSDAVWRPAMGVFRQNGYDTAIFRRVPQ
ncbi:lipocalin family protein [soil metagenome]